MTKNVVQQFEKWLQDQDCSPLTVRAYLTSLRKFITWYEQTSGKAFAPVLVAPQDARQYREYLQMVKRLAPATINRHLAALRTFAQWARDAGLIEHDPFGGVKSVAMETPGPRWLDRSEQQALLRETRDAVQLGTLRARGKPTAPGYVWPRRDHALLTLLLHTGLRLAEVAALVIDDVEIKARSGKVVVRRGKGRKHREVPLNATARAALVEWLKVRPASRSDAFFLSQKGGALSMRGISSRVSVLARNAGLQDVTVHTLRHSFAKNLIDVGVSLEKVAALLGHSSIAVTQRYITPSRTDLQNAAEAVA